MAVSCPAPTLRWYGRGRNCSGYTWHGFDPHPGEGFPDSSDSSLKRHYKDLKLNYKDYKA